METQKDGDTERWRHRKMETFIYSCYIFMHRFVAVGMSKLNVILTTQMSIDFSSRINREIRSAAQDIEYKLFCLFV